MERKCLECSTTLKGRSDKKFCDDACRNAYNNRQNRISNNRVRNINRILAKNRRILADLNLQGTTGTTKDILIGRGFNFNYFTSVCETAEGNSCFFVYEQGFYFTDGHCISLIEKEEQTEVTGKALTELAVEMN